MSLTWDVSKIDDFDSVCFTENDDINPVTNALIFATMSVGMNQITSKNALEFYSRLSMYENLFQTFLYKDANPYFIEFSDVQKHIGLSTNASSMTKAQFRKHIFDVYESELRYRVDVNDYA